MADNMKKISQINLQGDSYAIDVHNSLKAKLSDDTGDKLKVTTKGYVDAAISAEAAARAEADEAIEKKLNEEIQRSTTKDDAHDSAIEELKNTKFNKVHNGVSFLDENHKINPYFLSDTILGQLKFGGVINTYSTASGSTQFISGSSITPSIALQTALLESKGFDTDDNSVGNISVDFDLNTIRWIDDSGSTPDRFELPMYEANNLLEGFYFIVSCIDEFDRLVTFYWPDPKNPTNNIDDAIFEVCSGDWILFINGTVQKIDNTDAVKSVNGQIGIVKIDTGIMTINDVSPDGQGDFDLVAGDNITITKGTNGLTIAATVPKQVQADWNENDTSSPAYINNRTHYEGESIEIEHTESICYSGPPMTLSHTFRDGETYEVCLFQSGVEERKQFTVKPSDFRGPSYCLVGTFSLGADGEHGMTSIYLYGDGDGEYDQLISLESEDGNTGMELGYVNFYTIGLKQLDAKYIPVDGDTIQVNAEGKLIGATKIDLSAVDQDVNIINSHSIDVSGDVSVHGDLHLDGDIAFGNISATRVDADYIYLNGQPIENIGGEATLVPEEDGYVHIKDPLYVEGDLKFNGDFEIASLDAQSIKVNGKRVLVEGDAAGGSVAGITTGSAENSLEFFDGVASAEYAIAAGTSEKDAIIPIVGSTLANMIEVNAPAASGVGAIATGGGAEATSAGALAMGSLNRVGVTGFYWSDITWNADGSAVITLSTSQGSAAWNFSGAFDWADGDTISIVNNTKHSACATIDGAPTTNANGQKVITVDKLPFTEKKTPSVVLPDDYTVFACYKKDIATEGLGASLVTQERWYPRSGCVTIGWAGTAFGIENLVSGSAGFAAGWNNWTAGDFGAAFGRDSIAGYAGIAAGYENKALATATAAFGRNNIINASYALTAGQSNTINNGNSAVFGYNNEANAVSTFIAGDGNIANNYTQAVVGRYCDNEKTGNALFVVGNGSKNDSGEITRSNALVIDKDGTANVARTINVGDNTVTREHNIVAGESNTVNGPKNLVFGSNNTIASGKARILIAGTGNEATESRGALIGQYNKIQTAGTFAIGLYNKTKNTTGQLVIGRGNAVVEDALFIVGNCSKIASAAATYTITDSDRSNAFVIHRDGRAEGGRSTTESDSAWTLVTKDYVDTHGGGSASFPTKAADGSALQDGAILVYRNGTWVAENPPTTVYTGEVE